MEKNPKTITCPKCGEEIDATAFLSARSRHATSQSKGVPKTMSPEAMAQRKAASLKGVKARLEKKLKKDT